MKISSSKIKFLTIALLFNLVSFSQNREQSLDSIYASWIFNSISYVERNLDYTPAKINDWLLKSFYTYPEEKGRYNSFNGSVLLFLNNNFNFELFNDKVFFIQKHSPIGCSNNDFYYILDKKNRLTQITSSFADGSFWKKEKPSNLNFTDFENKFKNYKDYEVIEDSDNMLLAYYIITEFDKGKVTQKVILD